MAMLAKAFYSLILLGIAGFVLRELWTVWFDTRVFIGKFDVVSQSGASEASGAAFAKRVVGAQAILSQQLTDYQKRRSADSPSDNTFVIPGMSPVSLPPAALGGVDITVQSINVSQILTSLRRSFVSPSEVSGRITVRDGSVLGTVDWPAPASVRPEKFHLAEFLVPNQPSEEAAAAYVAASITWARAARIDSALAQFPRVQFCDFSIALADLYTLSDLASTPSGIGPKDSELVRKRVAQLKGHYGAAHVYPEIYRLRADLLDLLPEKDRSIPDLVELQEDRLRYAMLSPKLQSQPEEDRSLAALALARPAILLKDGKVLNPPENWSGLLSRREEVIRLATQSVGLLLGRDGEPKGTGFVVAPGLMLTTANTLELARAVPAPNPQPSEPSFCIGRDKSSCGELGTVTLGRTVFSEKGARTVLVELRGDNANLYPPLPVADALPAANSLIGQYAFVVGFPFLDGRLPEKFVANLLGTEIGVKRLMPGRILAMGSDGPLRVNTEVITTQPPIFTTDISTTGGTAGGPLVTLASGKVIGVSYAGMWQGERGKFAYAEALPQGALEEIRRALGREENSITSEGRAPKR